jgi:hypothetical protein
MRKGDQGTNGIMEQKIEDERLRKEIDYFLRITPFSTKSMSV